MSTSNTALTDPRVKTAEPIDKAYKLHDSRGLYLLVAPSGGKLWRFKYTYSGREKLLALGSYPDISLAAARILRDTAKKLLAEGTDPSQERRDQKIAAIVAMGDTFEEIAQEWIDRQLNSERVSLETADSKTKKFASHVFPLIGKKPVSRISHGDVMAVLKLPEQLGHHALAKMLKVMIGQVLRYARATGRRVDSDVTQDLTGVIVPPDTVHHPAITDPREFGQLLRSIDAYPGSIFPKYGLQLQALLFARPGKELMPIEWAEIDFDRQQWLVPSSRMKNKHEHVVPLSRQAIHILSILQPITARCRYVFPNARDPMGHMPRGSLNQALELIGYGGRQSAHGFRASARTMIEELLGYDPKFPEMQLDHEVKDANGTAYNRTAFLPQRREMMQAWADYLDRLRLGQNS